MHPAPSLTQQPSHQIQMGQSPQMGPQHPQGSHQSPHIMQGAQPHQLSPHMSGPPPHMRPSAPQPAGARPPFPHQNMPQPRPGPRMNPMRGPPDHSMGMQRPQMQLPHPMHARPPGMPPGGRGGSPAGPHMPPGMQPGGRGGLPLPPGGRGGMQPGANMSPGMPPGMRPPGFPPGMPPQGMRPPPGMFPTGVSGCKCTRCKI